MNLYTDPFKIFLKSSERVLVLTVTFSWIVLYWITLPITCNCRSLVSQNSLFTSLCIASSPYLNWVSQLLTMLSAFPWDHRPLAPLPSVLRGLFLSLVFLFVQLVVALFLSMLQICPHTIFRAVTLNLVKYFCFSFMTSQFLSCLFRANSPNLRLYKFSLGVLLFLMLLLLAYFFTFIWGYWEKICWFLKIK